jgi:NADPH-dependent ferric siderophore reductase
MVSPRRHARAQHLIVADERSLAELELALVALPICASGRVFIEVPDSSWICDLQAPPRMSLTWLDRSVRRGEVGSAELCRPGQAMTRAAIAYADEVLCDDACETNVTLLAGYVATADIVEHLTTRRGIRRESITVTEALSHYV